MRPDTRPIPITVTQKRSKSPCQTGSIHTRQLFGPGLSAGRERVQKRGRSDCLGRARGGLTTKIHALVDAFGRPIRLMLSAGQAYDGHAALDLLEALPNGCKLLADRAYDSNAIRALIKAQGAAAVIPSMPQRNPVIPHDKHRYKDRNRVERFFNKLKHFRAVATRYDKRDDNFLASVQIASIRSWLRNYEPVS